LLPVTTVSVFFTGKLAMDDSEDENSQHSGGTTTSHRGFKSQLDKALTARQEAEAKVATLEEKIQQYESANVELKQKVYCIRIVAVVNTRLKLLT